MKLSLTDVEGQTVPCNSEGSWSAAQKALATWSMIELFNLAPTQNTPELRAAFGKIYDCFRDDTNTSLSLHPFLTFYDETGGNLNTNIDLAKITGTVVATYRSRFGDLTRFPVTNHFPGVEDQLSLYKFSRWACTLTSNAGGERRLLLHHLRVNLGLQSDSRTLLIASAVEQATGLKSLTHPERSLLPVMALAMKILLSNSGRFDATERHALHTLMVMLGAKAEDISGLPQHVKRDANDLAATIAPEDGPTALAALLRLAILDHKITSSERDILSTIAEVMSLDEAILNDVQGRVELDTSARIRLVRSQTVNYNRL